VFEKMTTQKRGEKTRCEILTFIIEYIKKHGYSPSVREIGKGVGVKSTSNVHAHLHKMFDTGMIETDTEDGSPRAIRVPGYSFVKDGEKVDT